MLEHNGIRWGYVFLRAASHLGADGLHELMVQAVEMFIGGEEERQVKSSVSGGPGEFEGKLRTEMRYEVLGTLGGQRFDAELETAFGPDTATFLVSEQTQGMGSVISRN